ncbi:MAG: Acetate kinase [candidate division WS2 bacterium]|nr:Acetate kinase [Candidatus Psychracetigena formicireducens]
MVILVINSGSSSLKFQLVDIPPCRVLSKGNVERIGLPDPFITYFAIHKGEPSPDSFKFGGSRDSSLQYSSVHLAKKTLRREEIPNHRAALEKVFEILTEPDLGVIPDERVIQAVGHRVVHGGEKFSESVLINEEVLQVLEENSILAPLHNPPNLMGIYACMKLLPNLPQVAVFDTAFHHSIPAEAFLYGLPYEFYEREGVRKYGFHGTSHRYITRKAAEMTGIPLDKLNMISCHLGGGASVAAIKKGWSIDTSMGYTPLEGIMMATRCGDIDPYLPLYLMRRHDMSLDEANDFLNKHCGVIGLSGIKGDMKDVELAAAEGDSLAYLSMKVYAYRIKKYIGSYSAILGGVDVIAFTGGVGQNSPVIREMILEGLDYMGINLDKEKNNQCRSNGRITTPSSKIKVLVIPTNEEYIIAEDTHMIISKSIKRPRIL